ncbi:ras-related protein Rab-19 isoform X1 [Mus musculus]|uniref:ras-related protein Rab-19 isoform X1 n=1 Tax=Mus musculus TaxID=10090 RepID=UPI0003D71CD0|nr:ras-related protein Rab-19 isoform X1 [Mus musculus]|eukprot:XP_006505823.1 PREDICTED: ras-related protein Rab-19 isoform X1 [Mus musculus]
MSQSPGKYCGRMPLSVNILRDPLKPVQFSLCHPLCQSSSQWMQVWDTAGQERFRTITQSYYRSAHAAIIAYDLTRRSTFESVPHWIHEIEKYGAANLVIMLIGNKSDLWEKRHVLFEDACTLAEKHGLLAVLETSAKESRNIDEVFVLMAKELIARNSLHLYGESAQQGLSQDSSPVLVAQVPNESTRCTC